MTEIQREKIEAIIGESILDIQALLGGSTARVVCVRGKSGQQWAVKSGGAQKDAFLCEARGLEELEKAKGVRIPVVYHADEDILISEWISFGIRQPNTFRDFGSQFAQQHRFESKFWGFETDNYCGLTPQKNTPECAASDSTWADFYFTHRLDYQIELAKSSGAADKAMIETYHELREKRALIVPDDGAKPCLLHGDLWSGNYLIDEQGEVVLIDPAVYYGHREADLAMTQLFGGFPPEFYDAYHAAYPLLDGWEERQPLYQLYHLLNHLNLMGSGYYGQAMAAMHASLRLG